MRREDVLDRILDRHDVAGGVADLGQRGVERGRLAASRRAGAQHHAERAPARCFEYLVWVSTGHAEVARAGGRDRVLSRSRMTHFSPQIVATVATRTSTSLPSISVRQLAVLRPASLDDVHAGHDLDAADQSEAHRGGKRQDLLQRAVDPVADPDDVVGGLDVHVGGPVTHGLGQDAIDDLDDRSVLGDDHAGPSGSTTRLREPSTASNAWTSWATPPMAR